MPASEYAPWVRNSVNVLAGLPYLL